MIAMSVTGVGVCASCIIMLIAIVTRIVNWFNNALIDKQLQITSFVNLKNDLKEKPFIAHIM